MDKRPPEYHVWRAMIYRCYSPTAKAYPAYGGRGIVVCERWRKSFENFLADMGPRPPGLQIERKNNDGPYSPDNCIWATPKTQMRNRRVTHRITIDGVTQCLSAWAEQTGLTPTGFAERLSRNVATPDLLRAEDSRCRNITINGVTKSVTEWADHYGIKRMTVYSRLNMGWDDSRLFQPVAQRYIGRAHPKGFSHGKTKTT